MHAVFIQNPASIYDDVHGQWYNFPKQYLGMVTETVERLVNPAMRLMLDDVDPRHHPHPDYLRWHREKDYD